MVRSFGDSNINRIKSMTYISLVLKTRKSAETMNFELWRYYGKH